jgi:hypothetical protein
MTRVLSGLLVAVATAVATAILLGILARGLGPVTATLALLAGLVAGAFAAARSERDRPFAPLPAEWFVIGAFVLASLRAFLWLIYRHEDDFFVLSPHNLGDLSLHLGLINYLASGVPLWPDAQILAGETLRYPVGANLFNSLLLLVGVPVHRGLVVVGFFGAILTGCALWRWGRGFALAALLFSGGLAAFVAFGGGDWGIRDFQADTEWPWKNFFLTMLVTQRGLLLALPAGLLLLDDWRGRWLSVEPRPTLPHWAALLLYATMPLFSVHTFLFLSLVLLAIYLLAKHPAHRRAARQFVLYALLPATICMTLVTGIFSSAGGIHWQIGWLQDDRPIWFWLRNFGLIPFLWIAALALAIIRRDRDSLALLAPATAFFLLCCFVSFAPWPWDNVKIMLWCWLAVVPFVWDTVLRPLPLWGRAPIVFVLFFSGALSLVGGLDGRHGYALIQRADLDLTTSAVRDLPPTARFASAPEYNHPLILAGRPVAAGYEGHLWSHGLDYRDTYAALDRLMTQQPGWRKDATTLGVDYLYWGRPERQRYGGGQKRWTDKLPIATRSQGFTIYDLRESPAAPE